ncbi:ABC transporter substrate-binding protein [Labrys miyagiensis]
MRALFLGTLLLCCLAGTANAHPHVFVTSVSEVVYDDQGRVTGVKQNWTFDEAFSSYATQGMQQSADGSYTREALAPLAETNVENLKDFGYFTFAKLGGKELLFRPPVDYYLSYANNVLTLHFLLPLSSPQKQGQKALAIQIYDPTYYVAFDLAEQNPVSIAGAPQGCALNVIRPKPPSDSQKQAALQLDEAYFSALDENKDFGAKFANNIQVNCP